MKLISIHFPPEKRGTAYGLYLAAVYIGSALASLTLLLADQLGWRISFTIVGMFGIILALIGSLTIENTSIEKDLQMTHGNSSEKSDWKQIIKNKTLIITLIATFCRYSAGFSRGYFEAIYISSQFPDNKIEYSIINAIALLITPINLALVGKFSDVKESQNQPKWRAILCGVTNLFSVPLLITMYVTNSFPLAMTCLILVYAFGES